MEYKLILSKERAQHLADYLPSHMVKKLIPDSDDDLVIEIVIEGNSDLLQVFHAGIHFGLDRKRSF